MEFYGILHRKFPIDLIITDTLTKCVLNSKYIFEEQSIIYHFLSKL